MSNAPESPGKPNETAASRTAEPGLDVDALRQLGDAGRRYAEIVGQVQASASKSYYDLLNELGQTIQSIAQDRTAADLITRYQLEVVRQWRTQELSNMQQQYVDTVQKLLKLQSEHSTKLCGVLESLQVKAAKLGEEGAGAAEQAAKNYADAVSAVADDKTLKELDPASLARLAFGVLAAATIRAQAPSR